MPKTFYARSSLVLAGATTIASACGSSAPSLRWSDYTRTCGADLDCTPIAVTQQCECPLCNNAAINRVDIQKYNADKAQYLSECKATLCSNIACATVSAWCDNGTCEVR